MNELQNNNSSLKDENTIVIAMSSKKVWKLTTLIFFGLFVFAQVFGWNMNLARRITWGKTVNTQAAATAKKQIDQTALAAKLEAQVLPVQGVTLPIKWDDLGKKLIQAGVINQAKFESLYTDRGGLGEPEKKLLSGVDNGTIAINQDNAGFLLNLLWAFGLGNKNSILEKGPMQDPRYGGAGKFASTGGWTLANDQAMNHYSKHSLVKLTAEQQALVENVSANIYRPCCGNSTIFPDCNHGMAMLGLLELMAANGVSETEIYKTALAVNAYWFPSTYVTLAKYFNGQGVSWEKVDPKIALSANYSSSAGYKKILSQVEPAPTSGGGGCGV